MRNDYDFIRFIMPTAKETKMFDNSHEAKMRILRARLREEISPKPKETKMVAPAAGAGARPLYIIAAEIRKDWGNKVNYAAKPYLDAMMSLEGVEGNYYCDSAKSIVLYFLSNAGSWRGETAKRVKAELKKMAGVK